MAMSKAAVLIGGIGLLLAAAGGATGVYMQRHGDVAAIDADVKAIATDADDGADDLVRQATPLYYTFSGPFTVNVRESDAMIQATVAVSTHYASTIENVKSNEPALRAQVVEVLSNASEAAAATDAGKQQLERAMMVAVDQQLQADGYSATVDAVYFSDFVIQGNDDG